MSVRTFDSIGFREVGSCFIDGNSALRNGTATAGFFTALPSFAKVFISASAAAGGAVGVPVGLSIAKDGYGKAIDAIQCRDFEGAFHKGLWGTAGASYAGLSGVLAAKGTLSLLGKSAPVVLNPVFGYVGAIGLYGSLLGHGVYGYAQATKFQKELEAIMVDGGNQKALLWLKDQIDLTENDLQEISKSKNPDREKAKILQRKWNRFELRTNGQCRLLVQEKLPGLLEHFDPIQAEELLTEVIKATFKERVKHILLIVLGFLGIGASVFVIIAMGPASPLLFAISSLIWVTVDSSKLHSFIGEKCWSWYWKNPPPLTCPTGNDMIKT